MTQPTVDIDELLHGAMRSVGKAHDLDMEGVYVLAAVLLVNIEPEIDEYNPSHPLLDEELVNAARTAQDRGLLEEEIDN